MKQPNVSVYGSRSCPDTSRTIAFLGARGVAYEFKDVDQSPEYNDYIAGLNGGKRVLPTLRIDNRTLVNPSERELGKVLDRAQAERPED